MSTQIVSKIDPITLQEKVQCSYWLAEFKFPVTVERDLVTKTAVKLLIGTSLFSGTNICYKNTFSDMMASVEEFHLQQNNPPPLYWRPFVETLNNHLVGQ